MPNQFNELLPLAAHTPRLPGPCPRDPRHGDGRSSGDRKPPAERARVRRGPRPQPDDDHPRIRRAGGQRLGRGPAGVGHDRTAAGHRLHAHALPGANAARDTIDLSAAAGPAPEGTAEIVGRALDWLPATLASAGYEPYGAAHLRERIAARYSSRGVPTDADQIIVTAGAVLAHLGRAPRAGQAGRPGRGGLPHLPGRAERYRDGTSPRGARPARRRLGHPRVGRRDPPQSAAGRLPHPGLPQPDRPADADRPAHPAREAARRCRRGADRRRDSCRAGLRRIGSGDAVRRRERRRRVRRIDVQGAVGRLPDRLVAVPGTARRHVPTPGGGPEPRPVRARPAGRHHVPREPRRSTTPWSTDCG